MKRRTLHNPTRAEVIEAFEDSFIPEPNSGCWLWVGPTLKYRGGYGVFSCGPYTMARAHRVSFELYKGQDPDWDCVLHTCDTPCCVNPDHLWLGSQADNMWDKAMKGRQLEGPMNPAYKHGRYVGDKKNPDYPPSIRSEE